MPKKKDQSDADGSGFRKTRVLIDILQKRVIPFSERNIR